MIIHLVLKSGFMLLAMVLLTVPVAGDWRWTPWIFDLVNLCGFAQCKPCPFVV